MLYTHNNVAPGCQVVDMGSLKPIDRVLEVNTKAGWIKVGHNPPRINPQGTGVVGERIRFRSIYPIQGAERRPVLFHCYARLDS